MLSKLDLAIIVVLAAGCAFWIEQGQRVVIDAPTPSELAAAAAAPACPDNDSVPYSANCLLFLSGTNWQATIAEKAAAQPTQQAEKTNRPTPLHVPIATTYPTVRDVSPICRAPPPPACAGG
jgi:hypothetical protein